MYTFPGHIAFGLYIRSFLNLSLPLIILAAVLPDIVDKSLSHFFPSLFPYGRNLLHSLPSLVLITGGVYIFSVLRGEGWRRMTYPLSWGLGHLSHLIADISFLPWFYPILSYRGRWPRDIDAFSISSYYPPRAGRGEPTLLAPDSLLFESLLLASTLLLLRIKGGRSRLLLALLSTIFLLSSLYLAIY